MGGRGRAGVAYTAPRFHVNVRRTLESMVPDAQPSLARRIAITVGATSAALLLRLALDPLLGNLIPWVTFFPPCWW